MKDNHLSSSPAFIVSKLKVFPLILLLEKRHQS